MKSVVHDKLQDDLANTPFGVFGIEADEATDISNIRSACELHSLWLSFVCIGVYIFIVCKFVFDYQKIHPCLREYLLNVFF